jgi:hypothetical protein
MFFKNFMLKFPNPPQHLLSHFWYHWIHNELGHRVFRPMVQTLLNITFIIEASMKSKQNLVR